MGAERNSIKKFMPNVFRVMGDWTHGVSNPRALLVFGLMAGLWGSAALPAMAQMILEEQVEFQPRQDTYTFTAEAGQSVIIEMTSEEFDTFVQLLNPAGEVLEQNDDYNGTPNATIVATIPARV